MSKLITVAQSFARAEDGATLAEYGLLLALIAVACIASVTTLGGKISSMFTALSGSI